LSARRVPGLPARHCPAHVFAESRPGPDSEALEPNLTDVYSSVMAGIMVRG